MNAAECWVVGGTILTMDPSFSVHTESAIHIRSGKIVAITTRDAVPAGAEVLDATNCLVLPGLVNGHTHSAMSLLRGTGDDLPLQRWLQEVIFPAERALGNREFVEWGSLLSCAEMTASGTTCFNDMYYFEECTAKAASAAGMRAVCGQTVVEISGVEHKDDYLAHLTEFVDAVSAYPLIHPAVAPHSVYGVSPATWQTLAQFAGERNLHVHTHLAETQGEVDECLKKTGKTPAAYFAELGVLSHRWTMAHGTCLTAGDIDLLAKYRVGVVHNPESNLKLGTKICPVADLRSAGVPVGIGTDGAASNNDLDLFGEMDFAAKLAVFRSGVGQVKARDVVAMATIEGARAIGLADQIGSLEVGKCADLITVDLSALHLMPLYDPYSHLVYAVRGSDVRDTMIQGRCVYRNRKHTLIDVSQLRSEVQKWQKRVRAVLD